MTDHVHDWRNSSADGAWCHCVGCKASWLTSAVISTLQLACAAYRDNMASLLSELDAARSAVPSRRSDPFGYARSGQRNVVGS